jgi:DNA-binding MarR family transcriptional regulator
MAPVTLAFLLSQVGVYSARRFAQRIAAVDLEPPLFRILNVVDLIEGSAQQSIGEAIEVPPSRMVALVDELERRGLIERRPDPSDRRIRALYLTRKGRRLLSRARQVAAEHEEELTRGMSTTDRARLTELLQGIVERQELGPGVHPGLSDPGGG